jgi:hypothetical protein
MYVNEPVLDWTIIVTELVISGYRIEFLRVFNTVRMKTVSELRAYLREHYSVAQSLEYKIPRPAEDKYNERVVGRLAFEYTDKHYSSKFEFLTAEDFAKFLTAHPVLANCVGFVPRHSKKKNNITRKSSQAQRWAFARQVARDSKNTVLRRRPLQKTPEC